MTRRKKNGEVLIEWAAVPNEDKRRGGWLPIIWINGRQTGDVWGRGYDLDDAALLAQRAASEEAARYIGDWKITILLKKRRRK